MRADYRQQGYTMEFEENEASIRCVAAPVRDARSHIAAGLSVASTTPYMSKERMQALQLPAVTGCADAISRELGFIPPQVDRRGAAAPTRDAIAAATGR